MVIHMAGVVQDFATLDMNVDLMYGIIRASCYRQCNTTTIHLPTLTARRTKALEHHLLQRIVFPVK
jgi:hypothetical protein